MTADRSTAVATPRPGRDVGAPPPHPRLAGEDGSMVSEYGLVAVLGATIAGIAIAWAKGGAVTALLGAVLQQLRAVVAA